MADHLSAASALHPYLTAQVTDLTALAPQVLIADADAIHDMRVAGRRLKSVLVVYGSVFKTRPVERLLPELDWLIGTLGHARDPEIQRKVLRDLLPEGVSRHDLDAASEAMTRPAQTNLATALESDRFRALAERLVHFNADPPWTPKAHRPKRRTLPKALRKQLVRLDRRIDAVDFTGAGDDLDMRLHRARKAVKRTRYALDAAAPVLGDEAKALSRQLAEIQDTLGDHNDLVVTGASADIWRRWSHGAIGTATWAALDERVKASRASLKDDLDDLRALTRAGRHLCRRS